MGNSFMVDKAILIALYKVRIYHVDGLTAITELVGASCEGHHQGSTNP